MMAAGDHENVGHRWEFCEPIIGRAHFVGEHVGIVAQVPLEGSIHVAGEAGPGVHMVPVLHEPVRDGAGIGLAILPVVKPLAVGPQRHKEQCGHGHAGERLISPNSMAQIGGQRQKAQQRGKHIANVVGKARDQRVDADHSNG